MSKQSTARRTAAITAALVLVGVGGASSAFAEEAPTATATAAASVTAAPTVTASATPKATSSPKPTATPKATPTATKPVDVVGTLTISGVIDSDGLTVTYDSTGSKVYLGRLEVGYAAGGKRYSQGLVIGAKGSFTFHGVKSADFVFIRLVAAGGTQVEEVRGKVTGGNSGGGTPPPPTGYPKTIVQLAQLALGSKPVKGHEFDGGAQRFLKGLPQPVCGKDLWVQKDEYRAHNPEEEARINALDDDGILTAEELNTLQAGAWVGSSYSFIKVPAKTKGCNVNPPPVKVKKTTAPRPVVRPSTCQAAGSVVWRVFVHGKWTNVTGTGPGVQSATPVADKGYILVNPGRVTVKVPGKVTGKACVVVTPTLPSKPVKRPAPVTTKLVVPGSGAPKTGGAGSSWENGVLAASLLGLGGLAFASRRKVSA